MKPWENFISLWHVSSMWYWQKLIKSGQYCPQLTYTTYNDLFNKFYGEYIGQ